jgi:hypothetical protein
MRLIGRRVGVGEVSLAQATAMVSLRAAIWLLTIEFRGDIVPLRLEEPLLDLPGEMVANRGADLEGQDWCDRGRCSLGCEEPIARIFVVGPTAAASAGSISAWTRGFLASDIWRFLLVHWIELSSSVRGHHGRHR